MTHHSADLAGEAAKAAPPLSVGGLTLLGYPLDQWVLILTGVYTLYLIIEKTPTVFARFVALASWLKERYGRK